MAVGIIIILFLVFLYYNFFSLSSVLNNYNFSKKDIITSKDYPSNSDEKYTLFFLSNKEQLGLIAAKKNKYGLWSKQEMASVTNDLSHNNFITLSIVIPKDWGEDYISEKTVLLASYIDEIAYTDDLLTTEDFHLNIENFEINDRKLLFVEAKVDKDNKSFGSEEVVQYLQEKLNILKK